MKHWVILKVPKEFPNYPNDHDFDDHDTFRDDSFFQKLIPKIKKLANFNQKLLIGCEIVI